MPVHCQKVTVTSEPADKLDKVKLQIKKENAKTKLNGASEHFPSSTDLNLENGQENKVLDETEMGNKAAVEIEEDSVSKEENDLQERLLAKEADRFKKEQFYLHLQNLLSRSQFYSKLLIKKIERHKIEKEKMEAKFLELKKQKELENKMVLNDQMEIETPPIKRRRGRKLLSPKELEILAPAIPDLSLDNTPASRQPKTFIGELRDYQLDGMEWLSVLYENGINGVLADEMGLGKTIQVIALFAKLLETNVRGPYLICAPLSTLGNWQKEFERFTPHIKTILYQGSKFYRGSMLNSINSQTVLITSYEIIMRDRQSLARYKWCYIVVDEGHRMKNPDCKFVRELKLYPALNRLLLTGTPLQNNLIELWSLLNFLMPDLFDDLNVFESWFDVSAMQEEGANAEIIAQEREKHIIATLHQILTPFLLRRTKAEVKLDIPPKKEVLIYARMSALEEKYYKASLNKTIEKLLGVEKKGLNDDSFEEINGVKKKRRSTRSVNYSDYFSETSDESFDDLQASFSQNTPLKVESPVKPKITSEIRLKLGSIIMHLKKIVTHPYLLDYPLTHEGEYLIDENLINHSGKLRVLDSLLKGLKQGGHKVLIFSQFTMLLDILHDYCVHRGYRFVRLDGQMKIEAREENIKAFNEDEDIFIFLLSTRAGGLGLNLASADTVVIYDSDWNPQCDLQAQDRCHRYGQTKPVMVYRLVTGNTIDEKVVDRAHAKRKLEKMIMMKGRFSGKDSEKPKGDNDLIVEHLEDLLKNMDKQDKVLPQDGEVFTEQQLTTLLDRSGRALEEASHKDSCFKVINANLKEEDI